VYFSVNIPEKIPSSLFVKFDMLLRSTDRSHYNRNNNGNNGNNGNNDSWSKPNKNKLSLRYVEIKPEDD
jgi:hypothetical protein